VDTKDDNKDIKMLKEITLLKEIQKKQYKRTESVEGIRER